MYQRCKYGSSVPLVLLALSSAGQLIFLAMHASDPVVNLAAELCWLAGATVCTSCALLLVLLQRKYPPVVI